MFPFEVPLVFLDEPENKSVIEFIDYVDEGNRLHFSYLEQWEKNFTIHSTNYTLQQLLIQVNSLYSQVPPIPFDDVSASMKRKDSFEDQMEDMFDDSKMSHSIRQSIYIMHN